ncbi:hypothetical protein GQ43DRAFT_477320 [Delitschia confertaspora ATCC 74209]|uniref:Structure-specific endonuclease subunit SLX4 n=1 Tax=Delitschia confertaspora ATCC 74209 TaxID=1513339 RepID=A0A9P4JUV2_9PLEO|nr:hypothetical protein GQ43DRAFT_477320 [Delitschia confertaspora ATCC 74209]
MATTELVILSSSPPMGGTAADSNNSPPSYQQRVNMSPFSSRSPSPPTLDFSRPGGALENSSRADRLPEGAITEFATAGSLVRDQHPSLKHDDPILEILPPLEPKSSKKSAQIPPQHVDNPPKRPTKGITAKDGELQTKKPRQRKPKAPAATGDADILEVKPKRTRTTRPKVSSYFAEPAAPLNQAGAIKDDSRPAKSSRKPRAKKEKVDKPETQTKLKKGKITKPKSRKHLPKEADVEQLNPQKKAMGATSSRFGEVDVGKQHQVEQPSVSFDVYRLGNTVSHTISHVEDFRITTEQEISIWDVPRSPAKADRAKANCGRNAKRLSPEPVEELHLEAAISRRRSWTPIRDTRPANCSSDLGVGENTTDGPTNNVTTSGIILTGFACAQLPQVDVGTVPRSPYREGIMKRRRIELVDIPGNHSGSREIFAEKGKAPKKKARTITDLVTAQYETNPQLRDPEATAGTFFSKTRTTTVPLKDSPRPNPKQARPKAPCQKISSENSKAKEALKSKKANAKATKPKLVANKLLSPASAALRYNAQDILFGTSSQLAREESPTYIRQVQQAIKESEGDSEFLPRIGRRVQEKPSKLWGAAARDFEDSLLDRDDAVYDPNNFIPDDIPIPLMMDGAADGHQESFADIDTFQVTEEEVSQPSAERGPLLPPTEEKTSHAPLEKEPSYPQTIQVESSPPPTPPLSTQRWEYQNPHETSFTDIDDFPSAPSPRLIPESSFKDIDVFTSKLRMSNDPAPPKGMTSSKFQPLTTTDAHAMKRRDRPPKILSATPTKTSKKSTNTAKNLVPESAPAFAPSPPKTISSDPLPTTPGKKANKFAHIDEIQDSEDDSSFSPTPPRTSYSQFRGSQPVPQLDLRPSHALPIVEPAIPAKIHKVTPDQLEWENVKGGVFETITAVLRALPKSTDLKNPTWHERILMYDPIVAEDFTGWLNGNTTIRLYKKATVKQARDFNRVVRAERKAKGIKGKLLEPESDEGKIGAVETELESWMIKEWCEGMSVCCVSKEKVGSWRGRNIY